MVLMRLIESTRRRSAPERRGLEVRAPRERHLHERDVRLHEGDVCLQRGRLISVRHLHEVQVSARHLHERDVCLQRGRLLHEASVRHLHEGDDNAGMRIIIVNMFVNKFVKDLGLLQCISFETKHIDSQTFLCL